MPSCYPDRNSSEENSWIVHKVKKRNEQKIQTDAVTIALGSDLRKGTTGGTSALAAGATTLALFTLTTRTLRFISKPSLSPSTTVSWKATS